jgi:hypothetical protein
VLRQRDAGGRDRDLAATDGSVLIAPGAFDTARAFTIELRLSRGSHWLGEWLLLAAAER